MALIERENKLEDEVRKKIRLEFFDCDRGRVEKAVGQLCPAAQSKVVDILFLAYAQDKLDPALAMLESYYRRLWQYQPPEFRADPDFGPSFARFVTEACERIGVDPREIRIE